MVALIDKCYKMKYIKLTLAKYILIT